LGDIEGRGGAGDETVTFEDDNERVREIDGVVAPDRELEGDTDIGEGEGADVIVAMEDKKKVCAVLHPNSNKLICGNCAPT
jgi:hypothetical protein